MMRHALTAHCPLLTAYSLLSLLLLAGCAALRVPAPLAPAREGAAPEPPLEVAWRVDAGGAFGRAPALATAGAAIVTTRRGEVLLVGEDGEREGSVSVGAAVEGAPALVGGRTLIVPVDGGRYGLVALDLLAGSRAWRALRGVAVDAGVVVAGDVAVAPALDGTVYGVDLASGEVRWRTPAVPHATHRAPPVMLADGRVVVTNSLGTVWALDPATGGTVWTVSVGGSIEEAPAVGEGILMVPTTHGRLYALDPATGEERWRVEAGEHDRFYTPAVSLDAVVVSASNGTLFSIDPSNGAVLWRHESDGHVASAPLVAGGMVYAGTLDRRLVVLDASTGVPRWSFPLPGRVKSTPVALGALVLVPAEPGVVWAFRAAARAAAP